MNGKLYLVATPIGNLEDITIRAIRVLQEVDYIAAEDTRHTIKLLNHYNIKKSLVSYHEHNKYEKGEKIVNDIKKGMNVALVTDAGTPAISDPGEDLVRLMHKNYLEVTSIPGAVALINGLVLSGHNTRRFCFEGFLPFKKKEREAILDYLKKETRTIILYESPHKLKNSLRDLYRSLGNRNITITRELTKKFEEVKTIKIEEAIEYYDKNNPKGEYVIIIEGLSINDLEKEKVYKWLEMNLEDHMEYYIKRGIEKRDAIKQIAADRNIPKREVYNYFNR